MTDTQIVRLTADDAATALTTFALMAAVFDEGDGDLDITYVEELLASPAFWAYAALRDASVVGGLTAHTLPMTRSAVSEVFLYDLAVRADQQRRGVGTQLVQRIRSDAAAAGIDVVFVPADNADEHALDFYRALGGDPAPVTIFTFART